jgi:ApeA N-terminal domain 1
MAMDELDLSIDEFEQLKRGGKFKILTDKEIYGELTFAGRNTSLYIRDDDFLSLEQYNRYIQGILHNLTRATLVNCFSTNTGASARGNEGFHHANIFPYFIILGSRKVDPDENIITEIEFVVDDASALFPDYTAFSSLIDARPFMEEIVRAKYSQMGLECDIPIGSHPTILYFTGKSEIFTANTLLGKISASHRPSHTSGGPNGVQIKNTIFLSIVLKEAINFGECVARTLTLLEYLGMLVGRPQNLLKHRIRIQSEGTRPVFLNVYWSMPPRRLPFENGKPPCYIDILLNAVREPQVFAQVLEKWLMRDQSWEDARGRFFNSFSQQESYPIDRLIGAANMFDILPSSAVPPNIELSMELKSAKEKCRKIFKELPTCPERDSVLSTLGRIGKSSLKHKIRHRAKFLLDAVGENFPDLFTVIDQAVSCRNHYVHGSEPRFDYRRESYVVNFFTDTLEFIFAVSDLIEAGWDFKLWINGHTTMSHPFTKYCIHYAANLQKLQFLLSNPNFSREE